jgi:hypothetical protein
METHILGSFIEIKNMEMDNWSLEMEAPTRDS